MFPLACTGGAGRDEAIVTTVTEPGAGLARYGAIVADDLRRRFASVEHEPYLAVPMSDYPTRGGKALRPSLCLATCETFGGPLDDALPSAVAIELLHNAFLIHDDIEDAQPAPAGRAHPPPAVRHAARAERR